MLRTLLFITLIHNFLWADYRVNTSKTLTNDLNVTGDLYIQDQLFVNNHKVHVSGDIIHTSNVLTITTGSVEVMGNYTASNQARLKMDNALAELYVHNDFEMGSINGFGVSANNVKNGILRLGGNFIQKTTNPNFQAAGSFKVIFESDENQSIEFESSPNNYFAYVEINNTSETGVYFKTASTINNELRATNCVNPLDLSGVVYATYNLSDSCKIKAINDDELSLEVDENSTLSINIASILANDIEAISTQSITLFDANVSKGIVSIDTVGGIINFDPRNAYDYLPDNSYEDINISYKIRDEDGAISQGIIVVGVNGLNDDPIIVIENNITLAEDSSHSLSFSYSDADGDTVIASVDDNASEGNVSISNGLITYLPNPNFNGLDDFTILLSDGNGYELYQRIDVNVTSVNDDPSITITSIVTTQEDTNASFNFSFSDVDGDEVDASELNAPLHGSLLIVGTSIIYTPDENYFGQDSFSLSLSDNAGYTTIKTINVTVSSVNDVPKIYIDSTITLDEDDTQVLEFELFDVEDDNASLQLQIETPPAHGTLILSDLNVSYTPTADYNGNDTFVLSTQDSNGSKITKSISVHVNSVADDPSITITSTLTTDANHNKIFTFSYYDADGDVLSVEEDTSPLHGALSINANEITYIPQTDYIGEDSFVLTLLDASGFSIDKTVHVTINRSSVVVIPIIFFLLN